MRNIKTVVFQKINIGFIQHSISSSLAVKSPEVAMSVMVKISVTVINPVLRCVN